MIANTRRIRRNVGSDRFYNSSNIRTQNSWIFRDIEARLALKMVKWIQSNGMNFNQYLFRSWSWSSPFRNDERSTARRKQYCIVFGGHAGRFCRRIPDILDRNYSKIPEHPQAVTDGTLS